MAGATKALFTVSGKEKDMKKWIGAAFICCVFFACGKNNTTGQQAIVGKWELRQSDGGFAGTIKYPAGNGNWFTFDDKKVFQTFYGGMVTSSGTYEIKKAAVPGDWLLLFHYVINNQPATETDSVRFKGSTLIFLPAASCCDIPTTSYERVLF